MIGIARVPLLALAVLAASAPAATAQTVADTIGKWGLLGTWAIDCTKPASGSNGHLSYVSRQTGKVSHERDFGDRRDANNVERAATGRGGAIELTVHFPGLKHTRKYALIMGPDGRTRAMSNSKTDGTDQTIKDGTFTFNGNPSPWQTRCR